MFRPIFKGTINYELPKNPILVDPDNNWTDFNYWFAEDNGLIRMSLLDKGKFLVEAIESTPQKRTVHIKTESESVNFFLSIPYTQYVSVTAVDQPLPKILNFVFCSLKPFEKFSDLNYLPLTNIDKKCVVCLGKQKGFQRPRDFYANFWASEFNFEIYNPDTQALNEVNGCMKFFSVWQSGLKGIKYLPLDKHQQHFAISETLGKF